MGVEGLLGAMFKPFQREKPRKSPVIGFRNPSAVAAGGFWLLDFELEDNTKDYFPMRVMKVIDNDTDSIIEVRVNDSSKDFFTVLNRASEIYEGKVYRIRVINRGAAEIAADKIIVNVWNG